MRAYVLARMVGLSPSSLSQLMIGALKVSRGDQRILRIGALVGVPPSRCFAVVDPVFETFMDSGPTAKATADERAALLSSCYVFGDEAGLQVGNVKRAWETAVLKAHGHTPQWTKSKALAPASRAVLDSIDLHFHDLRHEAGSRLLEAGWPTPSRAGDAWSYQRLPDLDLSQRDTCWIAGEYASIGRRAGSSRRCTAHVDCVLRTARRGTRCRELKSRYRRLRLISCITTHVWNTTRRPSSQVSGSFSFCAPCSWRWTRSESVPQ